MYNKRIKKKVSFDVEEENKLSKSDERDLSPARSNFLEDPMITDDNPLLYYILSVITSAGHVCGSITNDKLNWCGYDKCDEIHMRY